MPGFPIDPELRIRASPPIVLRRTTDALEFIRRMPLNIPSRAWQDALEEFEAVWDEWSAMEAVVHFEILLEAKGLLLIEDETFPSPQVLFHAA